MTLTSTLRTLHETRSTDFSDSFNLRIHRALSWIAKAEDCAGDLDIAFVTYWIAFNAAYARELDFQSADRTEWMGFLNKICQLDKDKALYHSVWQTFPQHIRTLLDNPYVFAPFWQFHNGLITEEAWQEQFAQTKKKVHRALADQDTQTVLAAVFSRLYTLRNQIIHGGATYQSSINRDQLKDACAILAAWVPLIIEIMLNNPDDALWGKPFYPPVR